MHCTATSLHTVSLNFNLLLSTALKLIQFIALYCTVLHCTLHLCKSTAIHCNSMHGVVQYTTVFHCTALALNYAAMSLHCTALHSVELICTVINSTAHHAPVLHIRVLPPTPLRRINFLVKELMYILLATKSGRIGTVVVTYAEYCGLDFQQKLHRFMLCKWRSGGTAHEGEGERPLNWIYPHFCYSL